MRLGRWCQPLSCSRSLLESVFSVVSVLPLLKKPRLGGIQTTECWWKSGINSRKVTVARETHRQRSWPARFGSLRWLMYVSLHQCEVKYRGTNLQGRFTQLQFYDLTSCLLFNIIKSESRLFFFPALLRHKGTLVFSEGRVDMKETEEEHFKRFLTKDKAEIEALREVHQRFGGIIK